MSQIVYLPESSAAPWPTLDAYRPPGWRSKLSPVQAVARLAELKEERKHSGWDNDKLEREVKQLEEHMALLRQAWTTPAWVWLFAELMIGTPEVDPFWNPWSCSHVLWSGVRLLDGNNGRDGFDLSLWGRVRARGGMHGQLVTEADHERGRRAIVNGPHNDTKSYVDVSVRAAEAGHPVAAVVPLDGCSWFAGASVPRLEEGALVGVTPRDVMSCDVFAIPNERRMHFVPAPGIKPSSPNKGYGLALWHVLPSVVDTLWPDGHGGAVRVTHGGRGWVLWRCAGDVGQAVRMVTLDHVTPA